jgi:hypothetical protein
MIEESAMGGGPARAPGAASTATLLCLLLLVIYNANFRLGPSGDTLPAKRSHPLLRAATNPAAASAKDRAPTRG